MKKRNIILICISIGIFLIAATVRFLLTTNPLALIENFGTIKKQAEIQSLIERYYYQTPEEDALTDGIYRGMISGLDDPYSTYFTKDEYRDFSISTTGKYAGIGAVLSQDRNTKVVTASEIFEGSPAESVGIVTGDTIVSVEGTLCVESDLQDIVSVLRGEEGTKVTVVYSHNSVEKEVEITRKNIVTPSVSYEMLDEDTGYIRIKEFMTETESEFMKAIKDLESQGMENVVYDLRYNPGGLVKTVTDILDDMLPKGVTVYTEDKYGKKFEYTSDDEHQLKYPCVVLVNNDSASSSEIFAGAIRDFKYGKIIGTTTTGKGVIQNTYQLSDGSVIKLTIAQYFTPSGESIHKKGITPDIELEYEYLEPDDKEYTWEHDNQILRALKELD